MENKDLFKYWEKNAAVRKSPLKKLIGMEGFRFFSPAVSPILKLNIIEELPLIELRYIEIQLLYRYLLFTEYLETIHVNTEMLRIANDDYKLDFTSTIKIDAYKIYCDEAFHALQAANMIDQVKQVTGIPPLEFEINLSERLAMVQSEFHPSVQEYFYLLFVAVSECLVSQELNGYIKDKSIHPEIHELMKDHAKDEALHAAFFVEILEFIHNKLGIEKFQYFVFAIPKMIDAYLRPNLNDIKNIFTHILKEKSVEEILSQIFKPETLDMYLENSSTYLNKHISRIITN